MARPGGDFYHVLLKGLTSAWIHKSVRGPPLAATFTPDFSDNRLPACRELALAEIKASHNPPKLARLVVGELPCFGEELSASHRDPQVILGYAVLYEQPW